MTNPKYTVYISYSPVKPGPMTNVNISGMTQSVLSYIPEYFIATMPEVKLSATGSTYTESLTNLLSLVTTAPENAQEPYSISNPN